MYRTVNCNDNSKKVIPLSDFLAYRFPDHSAHHFLGQFIPCNHSSEIKDSFILSDFLGEKWFEFSGQEIHELIDFSWHFSASKPPEINKETYLKNAEGMLKAIQLIGMKKVVFSRVKHAEFSADKAIHFFNDLCNKYPKAFVYLASSPLFGTWIGASPESLLEQQNEYYCTMALAGTKKSKELSSFTTKEVKEQKIIQEYNQELLLTKNIDAVFSDISAYRAGELTHLKTKINFSATASERISIATMLHPTPAVGGVPRESAINFIANHENYNRELYAGYFGPIKKNAIIDNRK